MRPVLFTIAAAASALAFATPASAQWYPQPYGYAHGYHNYGVAHQMRARINQLQWHIGRLDSRDIISEREAWRLRNQSRDIERLLWRAARFGFSTREAYALDRRIARLEQRIWRDARDGNRWRRGHYGYRW